MERFAAQTHQRRVEVGHLVLERGQITAHRVGEIAYVVSPAQFDFPTAVADVAGVDGRNRTADDQRRRGAADKQVLGLLVEPVEAESQPVVEQTGIETDVDLLGGLPAEFVVTHRAGCRTLDVVVAREERIDAVQRHVGAVHISAQRRKAAVLAPAGTKFQIRYISAGRFEERFLGDGPTGRNGGKVAPAVRDGELRQVGGIGTQRSLDHVAAGEFVAYAAEVGEFGRFGLLAAHVLGCGGVGIVKIPEHRIVLLQSILLVAGEAAVDIVVGRLLERHTHHGRNGVTAERAHVVGEVLPLVVERGRGACREIEIGVDALGVVVARQRHGRVVRTRETVSQTRRDDQSFHGFEITVQRSRDVETAALGNVVVAHDQRLAELAREERRDGVVVAVLVLEQGLTVVQGGKHVHRQVVGSIDVGSERVHQEHRRQQAAVLVAFGHRTGVVFLQLVGGAHFQPGFDFIFAVDGGGQAFVGVGIALDDTVVVQIRQREVVVALRVAVGESNVVFLHRARLEGHVGPRCVGHTVPVAQQVVAREDVAFGHVVDVLLGVEHLRNPGQRLPRILEVVGQLAVAGRSFLGGDQHNAVTGLGTVDGGRRSVLQHLHRRNVVGVDTADAAQAHAVDNIERVGRYVRRETAHAHRRRRTRSGRGLDDLHAGRLALQGRLRIGDRTVLHVFGLHLRDGARHRALFLHAVAHYHDIVQPGALFLKRDVQFAANGGDCLLHITDVGEQQGGALVHHNRIFAVYIGRRTVGRAVLNDTGADHRTVGIGHLPPHLDLVLRHRQGDGCKQEKHRQEQFPRRIVLHVLSF